MWYINNMDETLTIYYTNLYTYTSIYIYIHFQEEIRKKTFTEEFQLIIWMMKTLRMILISSLSSRFIPLKPRMFHLVFDAESTASATAQGDTLAKGS